MNLLVVFPILEVAVFLDPPLRIKSPESVELIIEDADKTIIRGFIHVLVVKNSLWVLVIESKRNSIPVAAALPQILAYMMANSQSQQTIYGMVTNGDSFLFLKLNKQEKYQYDLSRDFSLFPRKHE